MKRLRERNLKLKAQKIKDLVNTGKKFLILTHKDPDGDAIGSSIAIALHLISQKKTVKIYNKHPVPLNLKFLKGHDLFQSTLSEKDVFDTTFLLDCSEFERVDDPSKFKIENLGKIIIIDHHVTAEAKGDVNVVDSKASSTAEIIFDIFELLNLKFDLDIAQALYTALLTDTGSFRYSNATPKAFLTASKLVESGAKPWEVAREYFENIPLEKIELSAMALSTLEVDLEKRFASLCLTREMLKNSKALPEHSDGLVNYPRSIRGIEVAMLIKEIDEDLYKVGLRSKDKISVADIALSFGGGGHKNAAGCTIKGDLQTVKEKIYGKTIKAIEKYFGDSTDN